MKWEEIKSQDNYILTSKIGNYLIEIIFKVDNEFENKIIIMDIRDFDGVEDIVYLAEVEFGDSSNIEDLKLTAKNTLIKVMNEDILKIKNLINKII